MVFPRRPSAIRMRLSAWPHPQNVVARIIVFRKSQDIRWPSDIKSISNGRPAVFEQLSEFQSISDSFLDSIGIPMDIGRLSVIKRISESRQMMRSGKGCRPPPYG